MPTKKSCTDFELPRASIKICFALSDRANADRIEMVDLAVALSRMRETTRYAEVPDC